MNNVSTTPSVEYNPDMDLGNMTCTDKSLNPTYVYEAAKDVNLNREALDTSILNEEETETEA